MRSHHSKKMVSIDDARQQSKRSLLNCSYRPQERSPSKAECRRPATSVPTRLPSAFPSWAPTDPCELRCTFVHGAHDAMASPYGIQMLANDPSSCRRSSCHQTESPATRRVKLHRACVATRCSAHKQSNRPCSRFCHKRTRHSAQSTRSAMSTCAVVQKHKSFQRRLLSAEF